MKTAPLRLFSSLLLWGVLLSTSADAAAQTACVAAPGTNKLLSPPASAQDVYFFRCGETDKVVFRVKIAFPAQTISDLILDRWQAKGWLPSLHADDSWKTEITANHLRVGRLRKFSYENSRGDKAFLILAYDRKFTEPVIEGLPSETIDLGDDLHVEASVTPHSSQPLPN